MRQLKIRVERGTKGFGLSLIYKGLDKYQEHETGVFVAKVVPGGQSQRAGLKENDRILMINSKVPHNVNDAVHFIKKAGRSLILAVERPDPHEDAGQGRLSRSGSVKSFNTAFGGSRPQSPVEDSEGEEEGEEASQQSILAARQAELRAQEAAIVAERERLLESQRAEQERRRRLLEEEERAEQVRIHQEQQARARAEEEERARILEDQLNIAQANAGRRGRSARRYSDSSNEEGYGGHHGRSKSLDARKAPRSKSPGAWSNVSGLSFGDLPELTRTEEKDAMKTNNNKLANYIDNVRRLQKENMRMVKQIEVIEVSQVKEINDLKVCYDREISDLKEAIRKMQDNYKNLQQNSEKILTENMDLKKLQERKNQEYEKKQKAVPLLRDEIQKLRNRIENANSSHERAKQQLEEVLPEYGKIKERLYDITRAHQEAKRERESLEDQCSHMKGELKDKVKQMEVSVHEVKYKKQMDIINISDNLKKEYDDRIQKTLADLRQFYETQMKNNREEFTKKYESKVGGLQSLLSKERAKNSINNGEYDEAQRRIQALVAKVQKLESENFELNKKVELVGNKIEEENKRFKVELEKKDGKIQQTLKDINKQMEDYQELLQVKTALDMEIAVYKQLLETEEGRLGITPDNALNDSFDLGSDEEESRNKIHYSLSVSTENVVENKRTLAQTLI